MNKLQIFKNSEFGEIRAIEKDGEGWIVGKDVAIKLGYRNGSRDINRHVDVEDRFIEKINDGVQNRDMILINESGLYSLVLGSVMPEAKKFRRWVTSEVLPSIRKTGGYQLVPKNFAEALRLAADQAEMIEKQNLLIGEMRPKSDYYDRILNNPGLLTMTQIAKDYGMSARKMNKTLHELGVQYKQTDQWLLYHKYHDKGYTQSTTAEITRSDGRPDIKLNTKWTQKGRIFLYELLKDNGILPAIERS